MSCQSDSDDEQYLPQKYPTDKINKKYIDKKFPVCSQDQREAGSSKDVSKVEIRSCSYNLRGIKRNLSLDGKDSNAKTKLTDKLKPKLVSQNSVSKQKNLLERERSNNRNTTEHERQTNIKTNLKVTKTTNIKTRIIPEKKSLLENDIGDNKAPKSLDTDNICSYCKQQFKNKKGVSCHIRKAHPDIYRKNIYNCDQIDHDEISVKEKS